MWGTLALYGANAASSLLGQGAQNRQAKYQNQLVADRSQQQLRSAAQDVSALHVQAGQLAADATAKNAEAVRLANQQQGQQSAMAGAAGVRGASVDAVQDDIQHQLDRSQAQTDENYQNQLFTNRQQESRVLQQARNSMPSIVQQRSGFSALRDAASNALVQTGMQYANAYFKFGSGTNNQSTSDPFGAATWRSINAVQGAGRQGYAVDNPYQNTGSYIS